MAKRRLGKEEMEERDKEIYERYVKGEEIVNLQVDYNLSYSRIYQIINKVEEDLNDYQR